MTFRFTESIVEEATLEWLSELNYPIAFGADISPSGESPERSSYDQAILLDRLTNVLSRINPKASSTLIQEVVQKITVQHSPNILHNNHHFHKMLTDGLTSLTSNIDQLVIVISFTLSNSILKQFSIIQCIIRLSTVTTSSTLCFSFSNSGLIGIDDLPQADSLQFNAVVSLNQLTPNKEDNTLTRKKV